MAGQAMAKPRGNKTQRYVFYLGLLLAGIAAIIVFVTVNGAESGSTGGSVGGNVPVVVANDVIPAQTRITTEMLTVKFVSPEEASADAFTSRSQLVDRVVTEEVAAGAQILPTAVSDTAGDGLAFKVEPGMRGISVSVQEVVIAGGNLRPGDRVDMVGIFSVADVESANYILQILGLDYQLVDPPQPAPTTTAEEGAETNQADLILTVTMLQNVKLLALAQSLTESTAGGNVADDAAETESEPRAATATMELTPQQAQEITWADQFGVIRMEARAVGDETIVDVVPTLFFKLENTR
ncbi:MAG: Flp pilus assembly protein CpaB [Chloroflexi bacterium]|nr:Flp pilus assembly protein CpaB [Chloroflexota bacterium]